VDPLAGADEQRRKFVETLAALSPDELLLLGAIDGDLPCLEVRVTPDDWLIAPLLTGLEKRVALASPENIATYLAHFQRLGLLAPRGGDARFKERYAELEALYEPLYSTRPGPEKSLRFERGVLERTPLFLQARSQRRQQP